MATKSRLGVSGNAVYTKKYETFRGVDFSKDASMVDDEHSPSAQNLIADTDGLPEKRIGWRTIRQLDSRINGIFSFGSEENKCSVIHAGTKIYKLSGDELTLLIENISDNRSVAKYFKGKLCILTGEQYLVFDGEKCIYAKDYEDMYAPITHISRGTMLLSKGDPEQSTTFGNWEKRGTFKDKDGKNVSYGTMPEGACINLVSGKRKICFEQSQSGIMAYILDVPIDQGTRVTMRNITTGKELFSIIFNWEDNYGWEYYHRNRIKETDRINTESFELMSDIGQYEEMANVIIGNSEFNNCGYVICQLTSEVFDESQYNPGVDNFSIEFTHTDEEYIKRIGKCTVMDVFENRLFFSGNPDYPNADWYSGVNDPLYIPDINYTEIGMETSSIMGYLRTGDQQAILKSDGDDASIYMRSYSMLSDGSVIFPVKQGTSGIGAIAKGAVCTLLDDPMYLSRNGVYAIALQDISSERALNIRSTRINNKLLKESGLSDAVMCEWNGYLVLCVGDRAYVADAAQKQYPLNKTNSFEYEWYYWTNIPARVLHEDEGELYFGTEDGRICKFNTDLMNSRGEIASEAYSDDGEAIVAEWSTNLSSDGDFMQEKTLVKTGSGVMLKSYNRSGVTVLVRTDRDFGNEITSASAGMFNFEDFNLSEFTFNTAPYCVVPFNTRVKKYSAIQIICRNDKPNHAFGIGGIVRRYFYGKIKK